MTAQIIRTKGVPVESITDYSDGVYKLSGPCSMANPCGYNCPTHGSAYEGDLLSVARMHTEHADPWWRSGADSAVETLARTRRPFTVDDVRDLGVNDPDHPNRWGGLFGAHSKRGLIRRTGRTLPSRHPERNGSRVPEWIGCAEWAESKTA